MLGQAQVFSRDKSQARQQPFFSELSSFHLGNKDLKPRTGSWRVFQILATINLAVWIWVAIVYWLGLDIGNANNGLLSIVFLAQLPFWVIIFAYLYLYPLPQKKSSTQP